MVGFSVKAALFPLHIWMPDAHAFAPSPVSAILSGLVIEMGAYGMVRSLFFLFRLKGGLSASPLNLTLCWLAAAAIIYGAVGAIFQQDLKLILAYSSVSQIGYIVLGIGLASYFGLLGSMLHIINHAVMKSALFLSAGALFYKTGWRTLKELQGMGKQMPITCGALALAGIAIVGSPPACGFVSEWYICLGAIESQHTIFAVIVLGGSLLSTIYYLRIINSLYFKAPSQTEAAVAAVREAPLSMLMPIWILALASLGLGIFSRFPLLWLEKAVVGIL
jgi:multicomponent Na+:H+ antiporter subunit D